MTNDIQIIREALEFANSQPQSAMRIYLGYPKALQALDSLLTKTTENVSCDKITNDAGVAKLAEELAAGIAEKFLGGFEYDDSNVACRQYENDSEKLTRLIAQVLTQYGDARATDMRERAAKLCSDPLNHEGHCNPDYSAAKVRALPVGEK